jgi:hypothetical protein
MPDDARPELDRVVGPAPRLIDAVLRPWSIGDAEVQLQVYVRLDHAGEVQDVADSLEAAAVEVVDVTDQDEAAAEEQLLGTGAAPGSTAPSIRVVAVGGDERAHVQEVAAADERIDHVVDEATEGPVWARFTPVVYADVGEELDEVVARADDRPLAEALTAVREVVGQLPPPGPALVDVVPTVQRFGNRAARHCELIVEDD